MKMADYYRHRLDLFTNGEVRFASKDEMLDFLSIYIKELYASYLSNKYFYATTLAEEYDICNRKGSEPALVSLYVRGFLSTQLPDTSTLTYKLMRKFKSAPVYVFDTHSNTQLYDDILKRLGRTGDVTVDEAFSSSSVSAGFEIEGDSVLRIR